MNAQRLLSCLNVMQDSHRSIVADPGNQRAIENFSLAYTEAYRLLLTSEEEREEVKES